MNWIGFSLSNNFILYRLTVPLEIDERDTIHFIFASITCWCKCSKQNTHTHKYEPKCLHATTHPVYYVQRAHTHTNTHTHSTLFMFIETFALCTTLSHLHSFLSLCSYIEFSFIWFLRDRSPASQSIEFSLWHRFQA